MFNRLVNWFLTAIGAVHWAVEIRGSLYELVRTVYMASIKILSNSQRSLGRRQIIRRTHLGVTMRSDQEIVQAGKPSRYTSRCSYMLSAHGLISSSSRVSDSSTCLRHHQCQLSAFYPVVLQTY